MSDFKLCVQLLAIAVTVGGMIVMAFRRHDVKRMLLLSIVPEAGSVLLSLGRKAK
ncbi:hypothetical protein [Paenibacillus protaetiae]|uniref:hypothetical protein n=1 Tax=Paenibacillus protaetiae TaxID=2509456 RepID=UPI0013EC2F28|nr:hypothetical protein [Paenibacillus protaetiae]